VDNCCLKVFTDLCLYVFLNSLFFPDFLPDKVEHDANSDFHWKQVIQLIGYQLTEAEQRSFFFYVKLKTHKSGSICTSKKFLNHRLKVQISLEKF